MLESVRLWWLPPGGSLNNLKDLKDGYKKLLAERLEGLTVGIPGRFPEQPLTSGNQDSAPADDGASERLRSLVRSTLNPRPLLLRGASQR